MKPLYFGNFVGMLFNSQAFFSGDCATLCLVNRLVADSLSQSQSIENLYERITHPAFLLSGCGQDQSHVGENLQIDNYSKTAVNFMLLDSKFAISY